MTMLLAVFCDNQENDGTLDGRRVAAALVQQARCNESYRSHNASATN